jgi:PAS domain S-box-containing protein
MLDFEALFEEAPNPYMVVDRELRYIAANRAYREVTGRTHEQLIGNRLTDLFPHDPSDPSNESKLRLEGSIERVFRTGERDVLPLIHYRIAVDGTERDYYWSATHTPLRDATGNVAYVLQHTVNLTELHKSRETPLQVAEMMQDSLRRVLTLLEQAPGFYAFLAGPTHVFEIANRAYTRMIGGRQLVGRSVREAMPEIDPKFFAMLDHVYTTGEAVEGHAERVELHEADGTSHDIYVDFVYQLIRDPSGAPLGVFVSGTQLQFETEARHLAKVLDRTRDFVGIATLDGMPRYVNAAGLDLVGVPDLATMRAKPSLDYVAPEYRDRFMNEALPALMRDGYWTGEIAFVHQQTGEHIPVLQSAFVLPDHAGRPSSLATITRDLRAQKAAESERAALLANEQAARAQAEQANRLKDEFLATISHELRTPLAAILGWVQMLRSGTLSFDKRERALEVVERNARTQAQLIEDLLDVGRIISGKLELEMAPTSIAAVVQAGVETVRPAADARGVKLDVQIRTSAQVRGDHARLQQVVWNLLSNSVKFTPGGGRVSVAVEQLADDIEIRVADTGAGIAPEFLPHVFERFRQSEGGPARKLGGLGLGLSIVHHVVTAHGGSVHADSGGPNQGATFTVRIPILRDTAARVAPALNFTPPTSLTGMRILVVDDEEDTREYVRMLLTMCNARVSVADSAQTALALVEAEPPDVLVSDIAMPEQDGYRLIRQVRALPPDHGGRTPAVALTAYARVEDRTRAMLAGFQNHVTKPVEPDELIAVIASLDRRPRA